MESPSDALAILSTRPERVTAVGPMESAPSIRTDPTRERNGGGPAPHGASMATEVGAEAEPPAPPPGSLRGYQGGPTIVARDSAAATAARTHSLSAGIGWVALQAFRAGQ